MYWSHSGLPRQCICVSCGSPDGWDDDRYFGCCQACDMKFHFSAMVDRLAQDCDWDNDKMIAQAEAWEDQELIDYLKTGKIPSFR